MSIFGKKPSAKESTPKPEPSIEINGCKFEGPIVRNIMYDWRCDTPQQVQQKISDILAKLNISTPFTISNHDLITEDGKTIRFTASSGTIWDSRYPSVSISCGNCKTSYSIIKDELYPKFFEILQNSKSLTVYFPSSDNYNKTSIFMCQDDWRLNIYSIEEVEKFERSPEMEKELLSLNLTETLTPADIYKILCKYVSFPVRIELGFRNGIFNYYLWKISIIDGKAVSYMESIFSEDKSDYAVITEVDLVTNNHRYECGNLEFSFKNGKFKFTTDSESYEEAFISCKAEIIAFTEKMKHLLD